MKTNLPCGPIRSKKLLILSIALIFFSALRAQDFKGKDGAGNFNVPGTYILNRYTTLASSVNAGSLSLTVSNVSQLSGSYSFTNSVNVFASDVLSPGDLIMIVQVQGADITTTNNSSYGQITNYHNTGNYELKTVYQVSANTIFLCEGLNNSYTQTGRGRTQVIRIPRFSTLSVSAGVTITGRAWSGETGGVVALEAQGNMNINGTISANHIGFRGGVDIKNVSSTSGESVITLYRISSPNTAASKGESIAGNSDDYNTFLNGAYGRGAPANGGGGGNGHNAGGGGGSNAGVNGALTPWNGTGIKDNSVAGWSSAWNLESSGFANNVSTGGGRGGYTFSSSNQNALSVGPGNTAWGGDRRQNVGGFGGRPLDYHGNTRVFMGGGGGAGDGNNNSSGDGGNGGGIVYVLANGNISGSGKITANGQDGFSTQNSFIDAGGGAGGGGAIILNASGSISSVSLEANGGKGGDQLPLSNEAEGPGGGGGGGMILTTTTSVSRLVNGGANGISNSAHVTEFIPNGATQGAGGTVASITFSDVWACNEAGFILPVRLTSFNALLQDADVKLSWSTEEESAGTKYELERSFDGKTFATIALFFGMENANGKGSYTYTDAVAKSGKSVIYYRLKILEEEKYSYSDLRTVRINNGGPVASMNVYPNPASNYFQLELPAGWEGKNIKLELYDMSGKLTKSIVKNKISRTETIDVNGLQAGVYVIRAGNGGQLAQQMIVKR